MPTPPSPITVPNSLVYRSVTGRTLPLSNLEVDKNFAYVENLAEQRLLISDFTSSKIIAKLNADTLSASVGGINANLLRGYAPSISSSSSTLVLRDSLGNFSANTITANTIVGNASTATLATSAVKLNTARNINGVPFDGTADITIADSTKLTKSGDTMTGKLTTVASTTSSASLRITPGVQPTSLTDGDVWSTSDSLSIRLGSITRQIAFTTSNISGYAANVSGIVPLTNGGTGAINADSARINLSAAKSGANSDITQLTGLTTALSASQGGTGLTSPGIAGNILKSNGVGWESVANKQITFATGSQELGVEFSYFDIFPPTGFTMNDNVFFMHFIKDTTFNTNINGYHYAMANKIILTDRIRLMSLKKYLSDTVTVGWLSGWWKA